MNVATLLGVLLLRRDAILRAFHSRWSLTVGAILVLSAGIARNYDGEDLLAEPWWLAAPFGASVVTSLILWTLFTIWAKPVRFIDYTGFLGVYWLTAPLAWLYGIPYERFLTPVQAVEANTWTLLIVSLWRVLIIARLLQVLYGIHFVRTLTFTLAFGSVTIFVATLITPRPVLDVMGGMRLPPEDRALAGLTFTTGFFSLVGSVILGLAALTAIPKRPEQPRTPTQPPLPKAASPPTRPTAMLIGAAIAVIAWTPPLLINQPLQRHRRAAEQAFARGDYAKLLHELSTHAQSEYPPNWRLPGAHLPAHMRTERLSVLLPAITPGAPAWIRAGYTELACDTVLRFNPHANAAKWAAFFTDHPDDYVIGSLRQEDLAIITWLVHNDTELTNQQREQLRNWLSTASPVR